MYRNLIRGSMVDRAARDHLALIVRRLAGGRLTNGAFESDRPGRAADPGVQAVADAAWQLYDDFWMSRLRGRRALTAEQRRAVARWVLFLHSDSEYEWPRAPRPTVGRLLLALVTFGRMHPISPERVAQWRRTGDFDVWPFFCGVDYERAQLNPRFLRGTPRAAA
jgi:hypothetical protein